MGTSSSSKRWVLRRNLTSAVKTIKDMLILRWRRITASVVSGAHKRRWLWRRRTSLGLRHPIKGANRNESSSESDGARERVTMVSFPCDGIGHSDAYGSDCEEDDVDGRAENFIADFPRRLQMERPGFFGATLLTME
ncbi:hypothetical protein ACJRO7_016713 [Eucalyptus globulus]|uniref:Uncharacterized protein n=1 Tax=Eucalyptus globulus TaxID=34317 RepID=A0ABD3L7W1_EUCGL